MTIRVVVAEKHRLVRETLVRLLDAQPDVEVVADVDRGDAAVQLVVALRPDVAILDVELPGLDGLQVCAELRRRASSTATLFLTTLADAASVHRAVAAGAAGYVHEGDPVDDLLAAIRVVAGGERYLSPAVVAAADVGTVATDAAPSLLRIIDAGSYDDLLAAIEDLDEPSLVGTPASRDDLVRELQRRQAATAAQLEPFAALTRRESDVLACLVVGKSAETIAAETFVSLATVRSHIRGVLQKLDVNSQVAAVALAWGVGWAARVVGPERVAASGVPVG